MFVYTSGRTEEGAHLAKKLRKQHIFLPTENEGKVSNPIIEPIGS